MQLATNTENYNQSFDRAFSNDREQAKLYHLLNERNEESKKRAVTVKTFGKLHGRKLVASAQ